MNYAQCKVFILLLPISLEFFSNKTVISLTTILCYNFPDYWYFLQEMFYEPWRFFPEILDNLNKKQVICRWWFSTAVPQKKSNNKAPATYNGTCNVDEWSNFPQKTLFIACLMLKRTNSSANWKHFTKMINI